MRLRGTWRLLDRPKGQNAARHFDFDFHLVSHSRIHLKIETSTLKLTPQMFFVFEIGGCTCSPTCTKACGCFCQAARRTQPCRWEALARYEASKRSKAHVQDLSSQMCEAPFPLGPVTRLHGGIMPNNGLLTPATKPKLATWQTH